MNFRTIHPFPARMAPEIAINRLENLRPGCRVLDPMAGSGTVLRAAAAAGLPSQGFDLDPLAVLMSRVSCFPVESGAVIGMADDALRHAKRCSADRIRLSWHDAETEERIRYWFAEPQRRDLKRLAHVLEQRRMQAQSLADKHSVDCLRLCLSRLIVTKSGGASLGRDVSHSRPHRVTDENDFQVFPSFIKTARAVAHLLEVSQVLCPGDASMGDARNLSSVDSGSVDCVLTSPPYLNAIDYMRGHRLALVWLGFSWSDLGRVRGESIGAERGLDDREHDDEDTQAIMSQMGDVASLLPSQQGMVERYAVDLMKMAKEVKRVLAGTGQATFVIGDSCLRGVFMRNSRGLAEACSRTGLKLISDDERELPLSSRYLPPPQSQASPLGKRMRTECIMTFAHA